MRRAAMWLFFLIMIASYSIAFSAVRDMNISWDEVNGLILNDGIILIGEGDRQNILESKKNVNVDQVEKIEIKGINADIQVMPDNRTDASIELKGYYVAKKSYCTPPKLTVNEHGDVLQIEVEYEKQSFSFNRLSLDLVILLPEAYGNSVSIESVSGDVNMEFGDFEDVAIQTISGDVKTESTTMDTIDVNTTSGEVDLQDVSGMIKVDTTSGDIDVQLAKVSEDVVMKSTSGEIKITVPSSEMFGVDFRTTSGEIQSSLDLNIDKLSEKKLIATKGNSEFTLDASTVSGI